MQAQVGVGDAGIACRQFSFLGWPPTVNEIGQEQVDTRGILGGRFIRLPEMVVRPSELRQLAELLSGKLRQRRLHAREGRMHPPPKCVVRFGFPPAAALAFLTSS